MPVVYLYFVTRHVLFSHRAHLHVTHHDFQGRRSQVEGQKRLHGLPSPALPAEVRFIETQAGSFHPCHALRITHHTSRSHKS